MRTFMALDIDSRIRQRLACLRQQLNARDAKIRWVEPENLHVTLNFLGEVADSSLPAVCEAATSAAAEIEPFDFDVRGLCCVPKGSRPTMIWAGVSDDTMRMAELQEQLAARLESLGFRRDSRPFKPHITVARIKSARNPRPLQQAVAILADIDVGRRHAEELVVYSSQLTLSGPIYAPVATAPLDR